MVPGEAPVAGRVVGRGPGPGGRGDGGGVQVKAPTGLAGIHLLPCPHCGASPGFRCRSQAGFELKPGEFHEARIAAAERRDRGEVTR